MQCAARYCRSLIRDVFINSLFLYWKFYLFFYNFETSANIFAVVNSNCSFLFVYCFLMITLWRNIYFSSSFAIRSINGFCTHWIKREVHLRIRCFWLYPVGYVLGYVPYFPMKIPWDELINSHIHNQFWVSVQKTH